MVANLIGIATDKEPAGVVCAYRSDGDTIPYVTEGGGQAVGDVLTRSTASQSIGVVQSLSATEMTQGATTTNPTTDAVAGAQSEIQLRVFGMFYMPAASAAYSDGDLVSWGGTEMAANATGAHEVVGEYPAASTWILVRINIFPRAAT